MIMILMHLHFLLKMNENIELRAFSINTANDSDIEEYHEINQNLHETELSQKCTSSPIKEFDFFTQFDVKPAQKPDQKKKKTRRDGKQKETNLIDIISAELASVAVPITGNIVTLDSELEKERHYSYLVRNPSVQNIFQKSRPLRLDAEYGWGLKQNSVSVNPIFPKVLENAVTETTSIPVQYIEPVSISENNLENNFKDDGYDNFLDITIKNVKFLNHHLFSLETMLCAKLIETYKEYNKLRIDLKELNGEIRVCRETKDNLKKEFLLISPSRKEDIRFDQTLRKYSSKLIQLKEQYHEISKRQRKVLHKINSLWSDIEMVREKFGHIETPYILEVVNEDLDQTVFEQEWTQAYNVEFNDLLDKIEFEYVSKYIEYKEIKNGHNIENPEKIKVNKPKLSVDEDALKTEVEEIVNKMVTLNKIDVFLKKDQSIVSANVSLIRKCNFQFELYVDKVFVCQSETFKLTQDSLFEIEFIESFAVQIIPKNEILSIVLSEDNEEVSVINIMLSEIRQNNSVAEFVDKKLIYANMLIQPSQKYVGSGHTVKEIAMANKVRLKSSNIFEGNLHSACQINLKIGWNENLIQNQSENIRHSMDIGRKIKRLLHGVDALSIDSIGDVIGKIYGRDVGNNENVKQTLEKVCKAKLKTDFEFSLNENSPEFVRLKLLHLRNIGGFGNVENKLVPLHASQISTEQLNCLQRCYDKDIDVEYISDKYAASDPIELQRFIGSKYVQKLNENMLRILHDHLMKKTHKDVVRDYQELSYRSFFSNQPSIGTISAMPKTTKQQYLKSSLSQEQEIQVTVVRAFNLMDRSSVILSEDDEDNDCTIAGFKVRPLRPFVRLSYKGTSINTATAIGCHPTWNQTIRIKTKLQPLSSLHINIFDEYKVNLTEGFSDPEDSRSKTVSYRYCNRWLGTVQVPIHTVLTLGVLRGTFKIATPPLLFGYEVLQNKDSAQSLIPEVTQLLRKESSFISLHITTSLSHFGGLQGYNQPIPSSADDDSLIKHLNTTVTDYTNDFPSRSISLTFIDSTGRNKCVTQFLQPISLPNNEYFPKNAKTSRAESALSKSSGFSKSSSSRSSEGRRREEERNSQIEESLYSARSSWKGESQMVKMINASLRYVSLIPTYEVTESHVVTLMGVELLKVLNGSPLDHTILLASYFLQLGIKCWVAIGQGIPRGRSSYVLTKYDLSAHRDVLVTDQLLRGSILNKGDGYLWNVYDATSGEKSELRDISCPLKTVDFVFDNENIWLNMQSSQECAGVSFDFTKSSNWLPVFDRTIFVMKNPLVSDASLYSAPADVAKFRDSLEAKIKAKVQKWRPQLKTIWNRYGSSLLREVLPHWEYWSFNPTEAKPGFSQRLKQLMVTYKLFGFPLNMAFASTKSVLSTVKATGLHVHDDPAVEFALAAEVFAYPNNVLSVWVFLASIVRV